MSVQAGRESEQKWKDYWTRLRAQNQYLPVKKGGAVNVAQVGRDSGIGRENIYKNKHVHALFLEAKKETLEALRPAGSVSPPSIAQKRIDDAQRQLEMRERQIRQLEDKVAVLTAENHGLRQRLKNLELRLGREDMILDTGRRIPFCE